MYEIAPLSKIDGSESRVTARATVSNCRPVDHYSLVQKGPIRDGSQMCADEDAVHFLLTSKAKIAQLKPGRTYLFENVRTYYVAPDERTWGPQVQIIIDDKSTVAKDDGDDDSDDDSSNPDKSTTHNPTGKETSNPVARTLPDSNLTQDLELSKGSI